MLRRRALMSPSVHLNGVDPDGESPPDELIHRPDDGQRVELIRRSGLSDWEIREYRDSGAHYKLCDDFAQAFAEFAQIAARGAEPDV